MDEIDLRYEVAIHEAGHVVADVALGIPFSSVRLVPDDVDDHGRAGYVQGDFYGIMVETPETWGNKRLRDNILSCFAGPVAQERLTGEYDEEGGTLDWKQVERYAECATIKDRNAFIVRGHAAAVRFVAKHWDDIVAVADTLYRDEHLFDREVMRIIEERRGMRATRKLRRIQEQQRAAYVARIAGA